MEQPSTPYSSTPWELPPEHNPHYHKAQRKNLGRIGFGFVAYLLFAALLTTGLSYAGYAFFPKFIGQYPDLFNLIITVVPSYLLGVPLFWLIVGSMPKKAPEKAPLKFDGWFTFLAVSFALMYLGSIIATLLMSLFESIRGTEITNAIDQQITNSSPWMNLVMIVICAPIAEELLCRKLVIDRLLPYSQTLAVLTSGLIFGLLHGNFYQFFYAAFLGIVFGYVYVKTGNVLHTIGMHMIINFTGSIVADAINKNTTDLASAPTSIGIWDVVNTVYGYALLTMVVCGVILLIRVFKSKPGLSRTGDRMLTLGTQFKVTWLNAGMIVYCVLCLLLFISSLFI